MQEEKNVMENYVSNEKKKSPKVSETKVALDNKTDATKNNNSQYSRTNGENLSDPLAIKSCKNEQNRDIIENGRLGSYDDYGNYIFIPEIRQELIEMPKLVYSSSIKEDKKTYDMRAIIPIFNDMYFKLKINKYEAKLILIENVTREAGQYVEVYEELVDSIALSEKEPMSIETIFTLFHIFENDDDYGMEFDAYYGFENILLKKIYMGLLSSQIKQLSAIDEHDCYLEMMQIIETSGEYGERIKKEFLARLRDRRQIFDINDEYSYDRAINEILLASIDFATTQMDKSNPEICEIYNRLINVRNRSLAKYIALAESLIDEKYVEDVKDRAIKAFIEKSYERSKDVALEYLDKLTFSTSKNKVSRKKHTLDKPLMKQLTALKAKESEPLTKEEKIAQIISKKDSTKKESKEVKKVVPSKAQKTKAKTKAKGKPKKKGGKKKGGAKVKKGGKVSKPKNSSKAKKAGGKLKGGGGKKKGGGNKKKTAKKKKKLVIYKQLIALYEKQIREMNKKKTVSSFVYRPSKPEKAVVKTTTKRLKPAKPEFGDIFEVTEQENASTQVKNAQVVEKKQQETISYVGVATQKQKVETVQEVISSKDVVQNIKSVYIEDVPQKTSTISVHQKKENIKTETILQNKKTTEATFENITAHPSQDNSVSVVQGASQGQSSPNGAKPANREFEQ